MTMPRIVVTAGEPAGIGPDLCVLLAQYSQDYDWVVIADPQVLAARALQRKQPLKIVQWQPSIYRTPSPAGVLKVWPVAMNAAVTPGVLNPKNSAVVLASLRQAVQGCLDHTFSALVTCPVHKGVINAAGIAFSGHTEFLAELTHAALPVMMLMVPQLKVALVTTHLPLAQVSQAITAERLQQTLQVVQRDLQQRFGIAKPRILVSGLNPHAGEGGYLGREELDVIQPVIAACLRQGMLVQGPIPADTLFTPPYLNRADVVVVMYHDQGLPVLKHIGFGEAVNISLGLPIVRTSVDHGTALDKAGQGTLSLGSFKAALQMALELSNGGVSAV